MSAGVIYILTNPSFPDYVKIGYTDNLQKRLAELNRSECIPYAFRAFATYEVDDRLQDIRLQAMIDNINPSLRSIENFEGKERVREFYAMSPQAAYKILETIAELSGTNDRLHLIVPTEEELEDEEEAEEIRRGPFRFSTCNIPIGSELTFINNRAVTVTVADDRHVNYNGEIISMSALASKLLGRGPLQGPRWFEYNGKILSELRNEIENINI